MNNDVLIKILTKIYSVFGENNDYRGLIFYKFDILYTEIRPNQFGNNIITISYKYNGVRASWNILYTDYSNELQKLRDNKIEILLN